MIKAGNDMDKTIEKEFFKAFEFGGVVHKCFCWMAQKYDLGFKMSKKDEEKPQEALSDNWQHYYDVELPKQINEETTAFDDSVICYIDSPLMEEIASNIDSLTEKERDRYVFSLLTPFKEFSDKIHPEAVIRQLKGEINGIRGIKDFEKDLKIWEGMPPEELLKDLNGEPAGTPKEQADACKKMIEACKYRIERANYVANRYINLTCKIEDGARHMQEGTVESCLSAFINVEVMFANRLDALLLERGINLLWYQQESGIYLKNYRCITDVDCYIGSYELAIKYIDEALPKLDKQQSENDEMITDEKNLPIELNNDKAKNLLQKTITAKLCDNTYRWLKSKALLAYYSDKASEYLCLCRGEYDGRPKTSWKPFEILFEVNGLSGARRDYQKTGTLPDGYREIDRLFE